MNEEDRYTNPKKILEAAERLWRNAKSALNENSPVHSQMAVNIIGVIFKDGSHISINRAEEFPQLR